MGKGRGEGGKRTTAKNTKTRKAKKIPRPAKKNGASRQQSSKLLRKKTQSGGKMEGERKREIGGKRSGKAAQVKKAGEERVWFLQVWGGWFWAAQRKERLISENAKAKNRCGKRFWGVDGRARGKTRG